MLAEWVEARKFSTTRLRPGYDQEEVDVFLTAIRDSFLGVRRPSLTPDEIRNKQFSTVRLRPGYDEEEVDAFLDEAELRLAAQGSNLDTGKAQDGEPELDAYGLPVQDRPARRLTDLGAIATLALGIVSLALAIMEFLPHHKRAGGLVALAAVTGVLAMILAGVRNEKIHKQAGVVSRSMVFVGAMLGFVAFFMTSAIWCPNCTG